MIRHDDGQFGLDCWETRVSADEGEDAVTEYSDNLPALRERAEQLLKGGRFQYLELSRWNPAREDWDEIEVFEP